MATKKQSMDELAKALTSATPAELRTMQARINGLLAVNPTAKGAKPDDWLWDGLVEELVSRGMLHLAGASALQRSKAYKAYLGKAPAVKALLLRAAPDLDQSKVVLQALGQRVASCLVDSLKSWTVVTPNLVLNNIDQAPAAVEQGFPGYMSCGLLGKLVKVASSQSA